MLVYTGVNTLFNHEYKRELRELVTKSEENNKSTENKNFSFILEKKLNSSGVGDIFEIINICITIIIIIFYILSTYTYPPTSDLFKKINDITETIELYIVIFLIFHFILRLYTVQQKLIFLSELTTLVDILSIVMIILSKTNYFSYNVKYFFRVFRITRIIYLFKIENLLQKNSNETIRVLFGLALTTFSLVFISISLILEIENYNFRKEYGIYATDSSSVSLRTKGVESLMRFHDAIYFELVTLTTEGYGDIVPKIWISRYITIFTVIALIFIVKPLHTKLTVLFKISTKYSTMTYKKKLSKFKHVLVLGECGVESFDAFLKELYNEDHGSVNHDTIIMQRKLDNELMKLIKRFSYSKKIFYFVGNSLMEKDLKRCKAHESICAIILANRLAKDKKIEDFSNILKAFSIKNFHKIFSKDKSNDNTRICIQLLSPETKEIYYSSLINENEINSGDTQIICVEEIKLQLLGKSCLCPGITTIISSLITSKKPTLSENLELSKMHEYSWLKEYLNGIQQEIYFITLKAELMHNLKFIDIVKLVYKVSGLVVIGIDVIIDNYKPFVCLNPSNYLISPFDTIVYILADKQPDSDELNNLIKNYLENNNKGIIAINKEMAKLLRLKSFYWNKIANMPDYFYNKENQASIEFKFSNKNFSNSNNFQKKDSGYYNFYLNENKYEQNNKGNLSNTNNFSTKSFKNSNMNLNQVKNHDYQQPISNKKNIYRQKLEEYALIRKDFFYTVLPRTQLKAETYTQDILENHIIICGIGLNLKNLLMPLRASSMKNQQYPILIMDKKEHIPNEIWKEIQYYPDVYYMQGDPMKSKDLNKAGIKKAKAVIILSKSNNGINGTDMVDMDTIFTYKAIKNEAKSMVIISELISVSALSFLNSENNDEDIIRKQGYWLSPSFAIGEILIGSMLDTLICQAFYNPFITNILKQLIMGSAGSNFSLNFQNKLNEKRITQSTLYLLSINEEFNRLGIKDIKKNMLYKEIFEIFVKNNMVPVGLYRANKKNFMEVRNQSYVYMCPNRNDIVEIYKDKIYILANESSFSFNRLKIQEKSNKINSISYFPVSSTSKLIDKSNELTLNLVQGLKKLVNNGNQKLKNNYSIRKVINDVRENIRNELNNIYDDLVEEKKSNLEDIIENEKNSKTEEEEGADSSPEKTYMEALKRTDTYKKIRKKQNSKNSKDNNDDG